MAVAGRKRKPAHTGVFRPQDASELLGGGRGPLVRDKSLLVPKSARGGYLRAACGRASPRRAIKAFCLECVGHDRGAVARCTGVGCPLYAYRPFTREAEEDADGKRA